MKNALITLPNLESRIYTLRDKRVMLDADLAQLYGVATKNLNKAVKRNLERFPEDFMFQLSQAELENLRLQFGTASDQTQPATPANSGLTFLPV